MGFLRLLLVLLLMATTGVIGAVGLSDQRESKASCGPRPTTQSSSVARFRSSFEAGDFDEWGGYNHRFQPDQYPKGAKVLDPHDDGVPRREGCRVARFHVTLDDAVVRRTHAKMLKSWKVGSGQFTTRPPSDVSGVYSAWYYLPKNYRVRGRGWVNIFQWKESYYRSRRGDREWFSDPTWWITLERGRNGGIRALLNNWGGGITAGPSFPRGRWVQVRAVLRQGRSIDFFLDGKHWTTARQRRYPVSPRYGSRSLGWTWGVGNYSSRGDGPPRDAVSGPLYVDAIRVTSLR